MSEIKFTRQRRGKSVVEAHLREHNLNQLRKMNKKLTASFVAIDDCNDSLNKKFSNLLRRESDMSLLYKDSKDVTVKVITTFKDGNLMVEFEADCGKFGTDEALDSYTLTPARLLDILQESAYREHEMEREMQQEMEQEMEQRQVTREMAQDTQDLSLEGTYI